MYATVVAAIFNFNILGFFISPPIKDRDFNPFKGFEKFKKLIRSYGSLLLYVLFRYAGMMAFTTKNE